jgi:hypothetical protein
MPSPSLLHSDSDQSNNSKRTLPRAVSNHDGTFNFTAIPLETPFNSSTNTTVPGQYIDTLEIDLWLSSVKSLLILSNTTIVSSLSLSYPNTTKSTLWDGCAISFQFGYNIPLPTSDGYGTGNCSKFLGLGCAAGLEQLVSEGNFATENCDNCKLAGQKIAYPQSCSSIQGIVPGLSANSSSTPCSAYTDAKL